MNQPPQDAVERAAAALAQALSELQAAAALTVNDAQRRVLEQKAAALL